MYKLLLPPTQADYTVKDGQEVVGVRLAGGAGRYRKDILNSTATVTCSWFLDSAGYKYLRAFYNTATERGSIPFLLDLILDLPTLTEHTVRFVPDTFTLTEQRGLSYTVSATLEVTRVPPDIVDDALQILFYSTEILDENDAVELFALLEELVNTDLGVLA